ncbi:MAG: rhamnulose-1-phosphate aldolase [Candidatus Alcyoniella australis]|nr:rhamnulose-1-phosphate aldolase [Candidatus Alcyoniella australis]
MKNLVANSPKLSAWLASMQQISFYLWDRGWAERNAGNLSVDVSDCLERSDLEAGSAIALDQRYPSLAGRSFLVTGTGRRYRDLAQDAAANACMLRIDDQGSSYGLLWGGDADVGFRPTSEFPSHLRIHEHLREAGRPEQVVLHTHPTELIALTHLPEYADERALNAALLCTHPEVKVNVPRGVGLVPYAVPGTEALAQATVEVFKRDLCVALWQWHGVVAVNERIEVAFDLIDALNKSAKVLLLVHATGHKPRGLSSEQLNELAVEFNLD